MTLQTIGDMTRSFALVRQSTNLKQQLGRLTQELSSGQASNLTDHLSGNLLRLSQIEHDSVTLRSHQIAAREAALDAAAMQVALGQVQTLSTGLAGTAITIGSAPGGAQMDNLAVEARGTLGSIIGALNTQAAGRALFSGTQTDRAPLASVETLLGDLRVAIHGAHGPAAVRTAVDDFFDTPGGGFETTIYLGGTENLSAYDLGAGESVALTIRGDDPVLRNQLKHVALVALSDDLGALLSDEDGRDLARGAGESLLAGQQGLAALRSNLGFAEARIDHATSRVSAEITAVQITRNDLVSVDPFETAANLEKVQIQIETLYTLTARSARLSLVNFLQ